MTVTVRIVDVVQYENRLRSWDFDVILASWPQSLSPGNEQRDFWGSPAADQPGSRNLVGIKNPAIDALIERVIFATNRNELLAATKALDRVLLWGFYVVPQWTYGKVRTARWDRFGRPRRASEIRRGGISDRLVVGCREGRQDRDTPVTRSAAELTRRGTLALGAGVLASVVTRAAPAQEEAEYHGISAFRDLKYPPDFRHFDYVNANAPKGGMFSHVGSTRAYNQNFNTFNSLNSYILKGDGAQGMQLTFASLMVPAQDEPDSLYGLAARAVRISPDGLTYRFLMRPGITFHDGSPITAHDVAFSLKIMKDKGHPIAQQLLRDFAGADAADDATVVVRFAPQRARDVPGFVAALPIFSRAYYSTKAFDETTLETPLGSGPYKVGRFEAGRFIEYERVKDWWGADLPVSRGLNNFDTVRYEFYRDRDVAFEGFTGKSYLFREEFTSRIWATRYDFPAIRDGRVKKDVLPDDTPSGAQGWFINLRRDKFKNRRLREALIYAFDFEWTNKTIMYGSYKRTHSVFQNSNMMAVGKPGPDELALLEPFRGQVSEEVFGEPFVPPVSDGSGQDRALLRKASAILQEAGFVIKDGKRVLPNGDADQHRIPDRREVVRAASHAVHQEPGHARHRGEFACGRSRAISQARGRLRLRSHGAAFLVFEHAGEFAAELFLLAGGGFEGLAESRRHRRPGDRCADRARHGGTRSADAGHRLQGAGSGDPCRPILDPALVQGLALGRLLGRVRPACGKTCAMRVASRKPGGMTATGRRRSSGRDRKRFGSVWSIMRRLDSGTTKGLARATHNRSKRVRS